VPRQTGPAFPNISQQHAGTSRIATVIVIRMFRCRSVNHFIGRRQEFGIFKSIQISLCLFTAFCNYSASSMGPVLEDQPFKDRVRS